MDFYRDPCVKLGEEETTFYLVGWTDYDNETYRFDENVNYLLDSRIGSHEEFVSAIAEKRACLIYFSDSSLDFDNIDSIFAEDINL